MSVSGIYIYGIVPNFYGTTQFQLLEKAGVYAITYENISAIVSDRKITSIDFFDRESLGHLLVHHQKTIEYLMEIGFNMIIPFKLATIMGRKEEVLDILKKGHQLIISSLKEIEYLTEFDLVATWADFSAIVKSVAEHPEILELKSELLSKSETISQLDQVKIGMLLQQKLDEKNKSIDLIILEALSSLSEDIKSHEVMNDEMVTNSAFLIRRNDQGKFEKAIDKLDEDYHGLLNFKLVGPLPCYSFFTIEIKELDPELIEHARMELELNALTSKSELKKAYLDKVKLYHPDGNESGGDINKLNSIQASYNILLDAAEAAVTSMNNDHINLEKEQVRENKIIVKIKE